MAEKLKFSSVNEFAVQIQRSSSAQRLAWLRQYYTSLDHPDLANTVANNFPQPDSAQASSSLTATRSASSSTAASKSHAETRIPPKDVPQATKKPNYAQKNRQPNTKQNNVSLTQKKSRIPQNSVPERQKNVLELLSDIPSPVSEDEEEAVCSARGHRRTKRGSVSTSGAYGACGGLGVEEASSSGLGSEEAAALLNHTDRVTPSSPDLSHGRSTTLSKPTAQGKQQEHKSSSWTSETIQGQTEHCQTHSPPEQATSTSSDRSFLTDLIGDISVLDDLFKPKSRGAKQRNTPKIPHTSSSVSVGACVATRSQSSTDPGSTCLLDPLSSAGSHVPTAHQVNTPVQASKGGCKDFWDILNEGNEESINRLTDPAEVQRICVNTRYLARNKSREEENKSLWKTNEKFLWKK